MLRGWHRAAGDREGSVKRHERAADLRIRGRVNLSALGISKEVIDHVAGAFTVIATGSCCVVTLRFSTGVVHGRPAEVKIMIGRGLGSIVVASMTCLVGESGVVSSHLVIMIIIAGRT
jgi:hypothetical protein